MRRETSQRRFHVDLIIFLSLIEFISITHLQVPAHSQEESRSQFRDKLLIIYNNAVQMPTGKICLIRNNASYFAIKFTKITLKNDRGDEYAQYECYYQRDNRNEFSPANIAIKKGEVSSKMRGIGRLAFEFGNPEIQCDSLRLYWPGHSILTFKKKGQEQGDYGIELGPTNWDDISQVNVSDPRIKWLRFDMKRDMQPYFIDQFWENPIPSR